MPSQISITELSFLRGRANPDMTGFNAAVGTHGGEIVPIRDFGRSSLDVDGFGLIYVRFQSGINAAIAAEICGYSPFYGFLPGPTREECCAMYAARIA